MYIKMLLNYDGILELFNKKLYLFFIYILNYWGLLKPYKLYIVNNLNNYKLDTKLILNVSEIFFWVKDIIIKKNNNPEQFVFREYCQIVMCAQKFVLAK